MLLNAILFVWNEEDIISTTIKNLFLHGCTDVYIIDNGSTDKTVDRAIESGATYLYTVETQYFDEIVKINNINECIKKINAECSEENIWWMINDADEFPCIPNGELIVDFLKHLPSNIRAVEGIILNHIPTHEPYFIPELHPADIQPCATASTSTKHSILRYDKHKEHILSLGGAHKFYTNKDIIKKADIKFDIHHFTYRRKDTTLQRLKLLVEPRENGTRRVDWYDQECKNFRNAPQSYYHERYEECLNFYKDSEFKQFCCFSLPYEYSLIPRWYDKSPSQIDIAASREELLQQAFHFYCLKDYDTAIYIFDLLEKTCRQEPLKSLLTIKICECFIATGDTSAIPVLKTFLGSPDPLIRSTACKTFEYILTSTS